MYVVGGAGGASSSAGAGRPMSQDAIMALAVLGIATASCVLGAAGLFAWDWWSRRRAAARRGR